MSHSIGPSAAGLHAYYGSLIVDSGDIGVAAERLRIRLENLFQSLLNVRSAEALMDRLSEGGSICSGLLDVGMLEHDEHMIALASYAKQNKHDSKVCDYAYYQLFERAAELNSCRERLLLRPRSPRNITQAEIEIIGRIAEERGLKNPVVISRDLIPIDLSKEVDQPLESNPLPFTVLTTDWWNDFEEQGQRFAHFVSELIGQIKGKQAELGLKIESNQLGTQPNDKFDAQQADVPNTPLSGWPNSQPPNEGTPPTPSGETPLNPLELAKTWLDKSRKLGGPTTGQKTFVGVLIGHDGWESHADLSVKGKFDWEDPRKGATNMTKRINESIDGKELWSIIPEDNSGCRIVLNSDLEKRS